MIHGDEGDHKICFLLYGNIIYVFKSFLVVSSLVFVVES